MLTMITQVPWKYSVSYFTNTVLAIVEFIWYT